MVTSRISIGWVILAISASALWAQPASRPAQPDLGRLGLADKEIEAAIARGDFPGAVLLVGTSKRDVHLKAYGNRALLPATRSMETSTLFDMASLSKPVGCATSVMLLIERGKIDPKQPVAKYLPAFGANGKEAITVEHLLLHRGGLIPDNPLADYKDGPDKAWERICALKPLRPVGQSFWYTDVGFITLGKLVEAVDGRPLDKFAREEIFAPLGMSETYYRVPEALRERAAPTEQRDGRWMLGEVHDPRAYALGGVAGHAGLFSTAQDLARYCRMILGEGQLDGKRVLKPETVALMLKPRALEDGTGVRTYGWDAATGFSSARGDRFASGTTAGHTGFTGTMVWIDPVNDCFVIFLTNRVHPDGKGNVAVRRRVATYAAEALLGPGPATELARGLDGRRNTLGAATPVLCGIDVLKRDGFKALDGRKIAIVTNHTGRDREGNRVVDLLAGAKNLDVVCLFSPEHGLYGKLDEKVGHGVDEKTGLKVYSLYGETRRPTAEMLKGVDTLVFDIQDVGARFYTFISTMGLCMEEAAKNKLRMVVLDRPNPITGLIVEGPIADKMPFSFTAYGPLPVSHGMTIGELAQLFNGEFGVKCDLTVIQCEGWKRAMWFDETGLTWLNPSPNMRNVTQALLYPGVCLLEQTNVSVGRGTDQPFEVLGAPWVNGPRLAAALNAAKLPGVRFVPIEFTPNASKHANKPCQGVYIIVTERNAFSPVLTGVTIAWHLEKLFGADFQQEGVGRLLHNPDALAAIFAAEDPARVPATWAKPLAKFKEARAKHLIYE